MDRNSDIRLQGLIARNIIIRALNDVSQSDIATYLAETLWIALRNHVSRPLTISFGLSEDGSKKIVSATPSQAARHLVISALISSAASEGDIWVAARELPELAVAEDFPWCLRQATRQDMPIELRRRFARFASLIRWDVTSENIDCWLEFRDIEPISSFISPQTAIQLDSSEAKK